jgi:hypothetical protein
MAIKASPPEMPVADSGVIDLESWRSDLHRLHLTMDQAVKSFVANQTRQLDVVATELSSQMERISAKEQCFNKLSDSIVEFVEREAARTELWGVPLNDAKADAQHEAYDAELPGPPALHRISRHWRKMTRAFEVMKKSKDCEASKALDAEQARMQALVGAAEERCDVLCRDHADRVEALELQLQSAHGNGQDKDGEALDSKLSAVTAQLTTTEEQLAEMSERLEQAVASRSRQDYEWDAEREELLRERSEAQACVSELQTSIEAAQRHEAELCHQCADRGEKLEQMKKIMDDQEREMTMKIERVQNYVKERQAGASVAEKKGQDAERMAERWQREVQRLQAEKDRLAAVVLDMEAQKSGQAKHMQGASESHQHEVNRLQEALWRKEEEMRAANMELLEKRDAEYQSKMNLERQKEKDRSIALLNKKQQEISIKDQQLKAARQRIQELESGVPASGVVGAASPNPCGSPAGRRPLGEGRDAALPPLPLSAR